MNIVISFLLQPQICVCSSNWTSPFANKFRAYNYTCQISWEMVLFSIAICVYLIFSPIFRHKIITGLSPGLLWTLLHIWSTIRCVIQNNKPIVLIYNFEWQCTGTILVLLIWCSRSWHTLKTRRDHQNKAQRFRIGF